MSVPSLSCAALCLAACLAARVEAATFVSRTRAPDGLSIPDHVGHAARSVTIADIAAIRHIDSLCVSLDGSRYAILVRQADPQRNDFRSAWFVGDIRGGRLRQVADGGEFRLKVESDGQVVGNVAASECRWAPNGQWIAYARKLNGEVQLWRSWADGGGQEKLTQNAGDVRNFEWKSDGSGLFFTTGTSRVEKRAWDEAKSRGGYNYDEDIYAFTDFMGPLPPSAVETRITCWAVTLRDRRERTAEARDCDAFERSSQGHDQKPEPGSTHAPTIKPEGRLTWLENVSDEGTSQVMASVPESHPEPIACVSELCQGTIRRTWWGDESIYFWRAEGISNHVSAFYSWSPSTGALAEILRLEDDYLTDCVEARGNLLCIRETALRPTHLALVDMKARVVRVVADVNPEFDSISLGKVERFEWQLPHFSWNEPGGQLAGLYPKQAYGYILYPPDFDPTKKYPVFIDPYIARGFSSLGDEHPLQVYAANGFIVLRMTFPVPVNGIRKLGADAMKLLYSADLGFPHLTMLAESTLAGLDATATRGFIDRDRVGIGGVSHGTFVPLYMLQKHDRIAAVSISSPTWGPHEYYWGTRKLREMTGESDWRAKPDAAGREYWSAFDIADHVDTIEAPILMQVASPEMYALLRLIRHLADAHKPYDAYVFRHETHIKWQPAHLQAIMSRNLDWFRFWLQDCEDPSLDKVVQYASWRKLRSERQDSAFHSAQ
jgi:dipeptidyl aminopeptidase/acylaminoacyl peptidase